jgi:type IV pilus assembly protein PilV
MTTHRFQAGFGIVEVMVALVVLSVGMLGIASLYVTTLQSSNSAVSRMQAVNLASDIADRIRANRFAGETYATGTATAQNCAGVNDCDQDEMAQNDLFLWQRQLDAFLPSHAAPVIQYVEGTATTPDTYTITLSWTEGRSADPLSYTLTMQIDP